MQEQLERAMARLVFGPELELDDDRAIRRWLTESGVSAADATAILESDLSRLFVYRDLIRGTLWSALEAQIPRVVARLDEVMVDYFNAFLAERAPRTHYLRDVVPELLDFCEPRWAEDPRVPAYLMQLARHEQVQIDVGSMQARPPDREPEALDLDAPVRFIEATRLMRYDYALHELSDSTHDRTEPVARPTALLVYRNPQHEVRYLELTPLAAEILDRLLAGQTLRAALTDSCSALGVTADESVLTGTARVLADLAERGALLGKADGSQDG